MEKNCACQGKNLEKFIQPVLLSCLARKAQTGYQLVRSISAYPTFAGAPPDATGVYRYLRQLSGRGLVAQDEEGLWFATAAGRACLSAWRKTLRLYVAALNQLSEEL